MGIERIIKSVMFMRTYNEHCDLKGYKDCAQWYLAWKAYKSLRKKREQLSDEKEKLMAKTEQIVLSHRICMQDEDGLSRDDLLDFYRFYADLEIKYNDDSFELTDEVESYIMGLI